MLSCPRSVDVSTAATHVYRTPRRWCLPRRLPVTAPSGSHERGCLRVRQLSPMTLTPRKIHSMLPQVPPNTKRPDSLAIDPFKTSSPLPIVAMAAPPQAKASSTQILAFIMDPSYRDDGFCVKEEWSALLKPKGEFDSAIGNYKCCLMEDRSKQVSVSTPGWLGASCGPGKHLEALQLCTEGLGSESCDETETDTPTLLEGSSENVHNERLDIEEEENESEIPKRHERPPKFPPPLPSIARNSQAGVFMKSFKKDGRFVLQEVKKLPSHEVLHAWRGDGRLKLHLVHKDDHPNAECQ